MTEKRDNETDIAFIARKLMEVSAKLEVLGPLVTEVQQVKQQLKMVLGWQEGQEEISATQSQKLGTVTTSIEGISRKVGSIELMAKSAFELGVALGQKLDGVAELSKSTFDMVSDLKTTQGGEDATAKRAEAL